MLLAAALAVAAPWSLVAEGGRAWASWEEAGRVWTVEVTADGGVGTPRELGEGRVCGAAADAAGATLVWADAEGIRVDGPTGARRLVSGPVGACAVAADAQGPAVVWETCPACRLYDPGRQLAGLRLATGTPLELPRTVGSAGLSALAHDADGLVLHWEDDRGPEDRPCFVGRPGGAPHPAPCASGATAVAGGVALRDTPRSVAVVDAGGRVHPLIADPRRYVGEHVVVGVPGGGWWAWAQLLDGAGPSAVGLTGVDAGGAPLPALDPWHPVAVAPAGEGWVALVRPLGAGWGPWWLVWLDARGALRPVAEAALADAPARLALRDRPDGGVEVTGEGRTRWEGRTRATGPLLLTRVGPAGRDTAEARLPAVPTPCVGPTPAGWEVCQGQGAQVLVRNRTRQTREGRDVTEVLPTLPSLVVVEGAPGDGVLHVTRTLGGADLAGFDLPWPGAAGGPLVAGLDPDTWRVLWTADGAGADEVRRAARGLVVRPRELGRVARGEAHVEAVLLLADGRATWESRWRDCVGPRPPDTPCDPAPDRVETAVLPAAALLAALRGRDPALADAVDRAWRGAPGAPLRVELPDWVIDAARPLVR